MLVKTERNKTIKTKKHLTTQKEKEMIGEVSKITNEKKIKSGYVPVKVLAVNPTMEEMEQLTKWNLKEKPNYVGVNGGERYAVISFLVEAQNDEKTIASTRVYLSESYNYNKDRTKVQIIDRYGRSAWATVEEAEAQKIPQYKNGPAKISTPYRKARRGEVQIVRFLADYLPIERPETWDDTLQRFVDKKNMDNCVITLDKIDDYFKGDFSELREILSKGNYAMKAYPWGLFKPRETDNGIMQDVFCGLARSMYCKNEAEEKEKVSKVFEKLIKDFYAQWISSHPEKKIWNKALENHIHVKFLSINETYEKASRSYESTMAVFKLTEILENATFVSEKPAKRNTKNQKIFEVLITMQYDKIKLTVGRQRSTQELVQYCITAPQTPI